MAKINIQFTLFSAFYSPLIVTMSGGFLKDEGLDFDWSVATPGQSAIAALVAGDADVIQTAPSQAFSALQKGEEPAAINFAQINEMDGFFVSAREPDDQFDWKKLEGSKVVMFKAGQPNVMFRYACQKAGIDYDKIIPVCPGGADAIDEAFRAGEGQYVQQQGPYPQQLESDQTGHIVAKSGPLIGPNAFSSLASTRQWLATDEAAAFTRAYVKARNFINTATASELATQLSPYFKNTAIDALTHCLDTYKSLGCWTPHIEITQPAFDNLLEIYSSVGGVSEKYSYEQVCTPPPGIA